jgi:hypothetical protein
MDIEAFENLLLDPEALEQERGMIPAATLALTATPADSRLAEHLYRGYRVMRLRPDGDTYCARTFARVDDEGLPQHHYDQGAGIEWGYLGHGPQTLAYDILAYEAGESLARYHHRAFHSDVVATLPHYVSHAPGVHLEWTLIGEEIRDWLRQQDRPHIISARLGLDIWRRGPDGRLHTLVSEQFLLDRRYALELELEPFEHRPGEYQVKVLQIYEEQFAPLESGLPVWQCVRDVPSTQVSLPFSVRVPEYGIRE